MKKVCRYLKKNGKTIYPFKKMEVGDSFEYDAKKYASVFNAGNHVKKKTGYVFAHFNTDEGKKRCFRIK